MFFINTNCKKIHIEKYPRTQQTIIAPISATVIPSDTSYIVK
jgi:hypothetical protein